MSWKKRPFNQELENKFVSEKHDRLLSRLLSQRSSVVGNAREFVTASYEGMTDPFLLPNMEQAVSIFVDAVENKKSISVIGDYDCDGVISSAMMMELCRALNVECTVFLPDRMVHGYGFSQQTLDAFKAKHKSPPSLLISLDCGSNNYDEVQALKEWGIENVIIIDHHLMGDKKADNADALVNWHLSDHQEMCTCGQLYQFIRGVYQRTNGAVNPIEFLTYAAFGTIGDSSPLVGNNRIIVRNGLSEFATSHVSSFGFSSLIAKAKVKAGEILQEDVSFRIVPMINASGRMAKPDFAYHLLMENDSTTADLIAENLFDLNSERKKLQRKITKEAIEMVRANEGGYKHGIMLCRDDWHIGIVGIVASKIVECFGKPAIVIGKHDGKYKGSGRTPPEINLKEILDQIGDKLFTAYGGHAAAVGVSLKPEIMDSNKLSLANKLFNEECEKYCLNNSIEQVQQYYDLELKASSVNLDTARLIKNNLYPYSDINPEPVFKLSNAVVSDAQLKEGQGWSMLTFNASVDGIQIPFVFRQFNPEKKTDLGGGTHDLYFKLPQDTKGSGKGIDISLIDIETNK